MVRVNNHKRESLQPEHLDTIEFPLSDLTRFVLSLFISEGNLVITVGVREWNIDPKAKIPLVYNENMTTNANDK